jgi:hypothetical protein
MLMWILRTIGWLMIAQAVTRLGFHARPAPEARGPAAREPESRVPAVDPADVIEAKFRPSSSRPPSRGSGAGTAAT